MAWGVRGSLEGGVDVATNVGGTRAETEVFFLGGTTQCKEGGPSSGGAFGLVGFLLVPLVMISKTTTRR